MTGIILRKSSAPKKKDPKKEAGAEGAPKAPEKPQAADPKQQSRSGQAQMAGESKAKGERIHLATTKQVVAPEPANPGDVIEFKHPTHGRVTRGRVTAQGMDGVTARVADGSAVQVPHGHVTKTLPEHDFGQDPDATPADAKAAFLAPTQPGGMPATPMQLALLDTLVQYGLPIDENQMQQMDYDTARKLLAQAIGADEGDLNPEDDELPEDPEGLDVEDEENDGTDDGQADGDDDFGGGDDDGEREAVATPGADQRSLPGPTDRPQPAAKRPSTKVKKSQAVDTAQLGSPMLESVTNPLYELTGDEEDEQPRRRR